MSDDPEYSKTENRKKEISVDQDTPEWILILKECLKNG